MPTKNQQIEQLTALNNELENYFRNTIIPQLFVDADLKLRKFTPPAMKQFNLSENDIGKSMHDIKENIRYNTISDNIQQVISSNKILEREIQTTDFRWYQMNIIPYITIQDNKTNGVIITFVEITQRVKDLKELEKVITDHEILLDTISHDIKTPLTSLVLAFKVIKNMPPENVADIQNLLQIQEQSVLKMQSLIQELTDTREQEHKYQAEEELLDVENIVNDVRLTLNGSIAQSGAVINSELNVPKVTFSRHKLRSIIYNLVSNAIKYKSPHRTPEILIKTERENNCVVISVKDNGIGIGETEKEAVFSKYFRIKGNVEGSGIGLYLVQQHVKYAGGKIILESEPDKGSTFKVYLRAE
ncbi:ATP-binding protein [Ilyomonas limi]|uniref:histidine kinase n=1 Tax=Ilyomonas limi TaxID=2575867 RepID=A0A4U3KTA3_9BACT|nr:ATP-binding protein [Ilyomonas limi]TKK64126.1 ATP-binding protein [Ilyomonas limi]